MEVVGGKECPTANTNRTIGEGTVDDAIPSFEEPGEPSFPVQYPDVTGWIDTNKC
jgi:hypothetical protein